MTYRRKPEKTLAIANMARKQAFPAPPLWMAERAEFCFLRFPQTRKQPGITAFFRCIGATGRAI